MKRQTRSILFALVIIAAILAVSVYAVIQNSMAPLSRREDKNAYTPTENVVIQANTFNGNIEIGKTTGNQIEIIYDLAASNGYLNDIKTSTNETKTGNLTTITSKATLLVNQASVYEASIKINLPSTGNYNLTLLTNNGNINTQVNNCREIGAMAYNGNIDLNLPQGTLFDVAASVGNGNITHQGITLDASTESATRLKAITSGGAGNLVLALNTGNGNIALHYS